MFYMFHPKNVIYRQCLTFIVLYSVLHLLFYIVTYVYCFIYCLTFIVLYIVLRLLVYIMSDVYCFI